MTAMCPHCGYNLEADRPLVSGPWELAPRSTRYGGERVGLTPAECALLYAIAKGGGKAVSREALLNRISDSESENLVSVLVHRLRSKISSDVIPFENEWGSGFRWTGETPRIAEAA